MPPTHADEDFLGPYVADPGDLVLLASRSTTAGAGLDEIASSNFAHAITKASFSVLGLTAGVVEFTLPRGCRLLARRRRRPRDFAGRHR